MDYSTFNVYKILHIFMVQRLRSCTANDLTRAKRTETDLSKCGVNSLSLTFHEF